MSSAHLKQCKGLSWIKNPGDVNVHPLDGLVRRVVDGHYVSSLEAKGLVQRRIDPDDAVVSVGAATGGQEAGGAGGGDLRSDTDSH